MTKGDWIFLVGGVLYIAGLVVTLKIGLVEGAIVGVPGLLMMALVPKKDWPD